MTPHSYRKQVSGWMDEAVGEIDWLAPFSSVLALPLCLGLKTTHYSQRTECNASRIIPVALAVSRGRRQGKKGRKSHNFAVILLFCSSVFLFFCGAQGQQQR